MVALLNQNKCGWTLRHRNKDKKLHPPYVSNIKKFNKFLNKNDHDEIYDTPLNIVTGESFIFTKNNILTTSYFNYFFHNKRKREQVC